MRLLLLSMAALGAAEFPSATISNGLITAQLYLPDAERGYYRGTRFDWSGNMPSLRTKNHEYFGQWFPKYDPKLHDAIMGPVEEFRSKDGGLGFADAPPGGTFVRIGVGVVRRPDDKPFQPFRTYDIVDPGKWDVKRAKDRIRFVHTLRGPNGIAYRYTKTILLEKGKNTMRIAHTLENTGARRIETQQYNHNFFVMDGQPTGPNASASFPFELQPVRPFANSLAEAKDRAIHYTAELQTGQSAFAEFRGGADYDIRVEHRSAKAGVRIRGDLSIARLVYWSIRTTLCPEPYVDIQVDPGKKINWTYTYDFYDLP